MPSVTSNKKENIEPVERIQLATFSEVLKEYRKKRKVTQRQLAERMGVHYNTIWGWEHGDYLPDTRGTVLELARQLELNDSETRNLLESSLNLLSAHWNIPYQQNPFFTGREETLAFMHQVLYEEQEQASRAHSLALSGMGGVGKTQTAVEYAYRHHQDYNAVLWLEAESYEHVFSSLLSIAELLSLSLKENAEQRQILQEVKSWLNKHRNWLFIIDNVQDIGLIKPLLPGTRQGSLLFTTRLAGLGTLARTSNLEPMSNEEARRFLLYRSGYATGPDYEPGPVLSQQDCQAANRLTTLMDGLPLALDQAGAYIEKTQCGLPTFLQIFELHARQLLHDRDAYADHPLSVASTFLLALEQLQRTNTIAADLLQVCSLLPADGIPEALFLEAGNVLGPALAHLAGKPLLLNTALQDLLSYSLIRRQPATKILTQHRLVQAVIREHMEPETLLQWVSHIISAVNSLFPTDSGTLFPEIDTQDWTRCQYFLPLALACSDLCKIYHMYTKESGQLLTRVARYLQHRGHYQQAEALCHWLLASHTQVPQRHALEQAITRSVLISIQEDQGRYEEALGNCRELLALYEDNGLLDHPDMGRALMYFSNLSCRYGNSQEARPAIERALALYESKGMQKQKIYGELLDSLANVYQAQERFVEAGHFYEQALQLAEELLGTDHIEVGTALNNLAVNYISRERYQEAESLYQRALAMNRSTYGEEHPNDAIGYYHLGKLYLLQERYAEAEHALHLALELTQRLLSPEHVGAGYILDSLSHLYAIQNRHDEARQTLQKALAIQERFLVPEHSTLKVMRQRLAEL